MKLKTITKAALTLALLSATSVFLNFSCSSANFIGRNSVGSTSHTQPKTSESSAKNHDSIEPEDQSPVPTINNAIPKDGTTSDSFALIWESPNISLCLRGAFLITEKNVIYSTKNQTFNGNLLLLNRGSHGNKFTILDYSGKQVNSQDIQDQKIFTGTIDKGFTIKVDILNGELKQEDAKLFPKGVLACGW